MNIILFANMGSGKDSAAELFIYLGKYIKGKLGEEIRGDVDKYVQLLNLDKKDSRRLYVAYGQGKRELFHQDIWCAILNEKMKDTITEGKLIIGDARQINEYEYFVNKLGFIPIGVHADDEVRKKRLIERDGYDQSGEFNSDIENQAKKVINMIRQDKTGYIIDNNGTIEELVAQVVNILNDIHNK